MSNTTNDNEYVRRYRPMERGSNEWYLYHHRDNAAIATPLITISPFILFMKSGIIGLIIIWSLYALVAHANNEKLNNDPVVLKKREEYKEFRRISDPRDPIDQEYYKKNPHMHPDSPEFKASVERLRQIVERDFYENM